jgi:hypothetical protein
MLGLAFVKPPLPWWAWTALLIGAAIAIVIDRILDGPRDE